MRLSVKFGIAIFILLFVFSLCEADQSLDKLRAQAEHGDAEAQVNLGYMYANGIHVPQNYAEAVKWYRKAADKGHAGAQINLGFMYSKGQGVPENYVEAVKWYEKAADQGNPDAQYSLGIMYDTGIDVPQNYVEAAKWKGGRISDYNFKKL